MSFTLGEIVKSIIAGVIGVIIIWVVLHYLGLYGTQVSQDISTGVHTFCSANVKGGIPADVDKDGVPDACDYCLGGADIDANNNLIADACEPKDFAGGITKISSACDSSPNCRPSGKCWSNHRNTCELDCYKIGDCKV